MGAHAVTFAMPPSHSLVPVDWSSGAAVQPQTAYDLLLGSADWSASNYTSFAAATLNANANTTAAMRAAHALFDAIATGALSANIESALGVVQPSYLYVHAILGSQRAQNAFYAKFAAFVSAQSEWTLLQNSRAYCWQPGDQYNYGDAVNARQVVRNAQC